MQHDCKVLVFNFFFIYSAGSRRMVLSQKEKEAAKMGLPVFTVRQTHSHPKKCYFIGSTT